MTNETVISKVHKLTIPCLSLVLLFFIYPIITNGIDYLKYDEFTKSSMYGRHFGLISYALYLAFYFIIIYYLIINSIYFRNALRIQNGKLYLYWRYIAEIDQINFEKVEYDANPRSIFIFLRNGNKIKLNVSFCRESTIDIFNLIHINSIN